MDDRTAAIREIIGALPPVSLTMPMRNPRGRFERTFMGPLLFDYAIAVGLLPRGTTGGGLGNCYFMATAADGFRVAVALAETARRFTPKQVILAYEQDGEPLETGVRLVVPGDDLGGRSLAGVVEIELKQVEHGIVPDAPGLQLTGLLERPGPVTPGFDGLPRREVETLASPRHGGRIVPGERYGGVLLWDLLDAAGVRIDPDLREDVLGKVVVVRSEDGYAAVIAAGEIEPRFMAGPVIVADRRAAGPLTESEGAFRLIVPCDGAAGRSVKRLASLELIDA